MPRTRVVIQSRLSSSRLPGKAMLTLGGTPAVVLVAKRAARTGHDVVVATSTDTDDDVIASAVASHGITCFRGSLSDPLARFVGAAADLDDEDLIVRLTADNCVPDGQFVDEIVELVQSQDLEYVRVATGLPYGLGAESFTVGRLREAAASATESFDREHVTPWIRRHAGDHEFHPSRSRARAHDRAMHDGHPGRLRRRRGRTGRRRDPTRSTSRGATSCAPGTTPARRPTSSP